MVLSPSLIYCYSFSFHIVPQPITVDSSSLLATQAPPDLLLGSEEGEKKASPATAASAADVTPSDPSPVETTSDGTKDSEQTTEKDGIADDGVVKKEESTENEPQVDSSTKSADEAGQASASAGSEAVEAMETDTQAGAGDGDNGKSAGDGEPSASGGDGATVSEFQQPSPVDDTVNNDTTATSEGGEEMVEETSKGEQVNKDGPSEVEEKGSSETTEAPKEDEGAVSTSPRGEEPVISEPATTDESVEREGDNTTQEGEELQQQVCIWNSNNGGYNSN